MNHQLKTWPEFFEAVLTGAKPYELRKADRPFKVGDMLHLQEFRPCPNFRSIGVILRGNAYGPCCPEPHGTYTGRSCERKVTHMLAGPVFGLTEGWVLLSFGRAGADQQRRKFHR